MSELKLSGKIKMIGEVQNFDSGFVKREFVITTKEQYPQDVKFEVVKEKATDFKQYNKVGDNVDVKFNVRGNEYNGKYYVSLQAWHVAKATEDNF
jgi:single-strand DNA-binding protein